MKVSEMTNEMLAKTVDEFVNAFHNDSDKSILREAAARLRKLIEFTPEMATKMCRRESDLRRRLMVAEQDGKGGRK